MKQILTFIFMLSFISNLFAQKHEIGIVLSGGGALGYAHIGALQALEEYDIYPTIVAGASMGSLIGAFYANGYSPEQICEFVKFENFNNPLKIVAPTLKAQRLGIFSQKNILKVLKKYIPHNSFDSLRYSLFVSVANLSKGQVEYVHTGDSLHACLLASSAIPTVFEAVKMDDMTYVDGGVLNNFPAQPIRNQCRHLIGVDVKANYEFTMAKRIKDVFMRTLNVVIMQNSVEGRSLCDVLIEPKSNIKYDEFSFSAFDEIYQDGYNAMKQYLDDNPKMVEKLREN